MPTYRIRCLTPDDECQRCDPPQAFAAYADAESQRQAHKWVWEGHVTEVEEVRG